MFFKGKKMKDKGIALCNSLQGFSANNRATSIIEKTKGFEKSEEILKSLRQVAVELSMEEFLRRFYNMWSDDAELLCKIMGYQTEFEYECEENPECGEWEEEWRKNHQDYLEEKMSSVTLLTKAKESYDDMDLAERFEVFAIQKAFEEGVKEFGVEFLDAEDSHKVDQVTKPTDEEVISVNKSEDEVVSGDETSDKVNNETQEEETLDIQEILKSAEAQEIIKALLEEQMAPVQEELTKAKADLAVVEAEKAEIAKAKEDAEKAQFQEVIKSFSFIGDDEAVTTLTEALFKSEYKDLMVATLTKAADALNAAVESEVGADGDDNNLNQADIAKSALQNRINEMASKGQLK